MTTGILINFMCEIGLFQNEIREQFEKMDYVIDDNQNDIVEYSDFIKFNELQD